MALLRSLTDGVRNLFQKGRADRELDDELSDFMESSALDKMRSGKSREQAFREARMELGGTEAVKENVREVSWESSLETLWNDLRFALRLLRLNPVFALTAILSLALGIGANTAIFQLLDAVRLRSLPVKSPQQIARVVFDRHGSRSGHFSTRYPDFTYAIWQEIRDKQQPFSNLYAWAPTQFNVSPMGEVHNVQGLWVSGEFFETLGVEPALGRLLNTTDDRPGCASSAAVLSYAYWQREYGGQRSVIGQTLTVNRHPFPIIGVASPEFYGVEVGHHFDVAVPICAEPLVNEDSQLKSRIGWWLSVMGRLKPGWNLERAATQLRTISPAIFEAALPPEYNATNAKHFLSAKLTAIPGASGVSDLRETYEQPLWVLLVLAGLVLLNAATNLANLMLARASAREKEMGMRMAVGASRGRLIRQLLAESLLIAAVGSGLGALLARSLSQVLIASLSTRQDPLFMDLGADWRIFAFVAALAVLTCLVFGLAPAVRATRIAPVAMLKESGSRGMTEGRSRFGFRRLLVVSQIALSLILLIGALLFARSLNNLAKLDTGFREDGVLVSDIDFSARHLETEARRTFSDELLRRVRAIPGVDAAASAALVPLSGNGIAHDILLSASDESTDDPPVAAFNYVSPGYFETLQTPLLYGRDFDERDKLGAPPVAIVNETFLKKFGQGKNPAEVKFRVRKLKKTTAPYEIIGVVKDTKYIDLREQREPIVYAPRAQNEDVASDALILLRSNAPLTAVLSAVKEVAMQADPDADVSFYNYRTMVQEGLTRDRLMARLSGFFGALAVLLAVIGLYGVISYMVASRRSEIGIRMALGAEQRRIVWLVLREAAVLLGIGLGIGTVLALAVGRTATSLLFGLKPTDATTFALALTVLSIVAVGAAFLPARRAAAIDPISCLRNE